MPTRQCRGEENSKLAQLLALEKAMGDSTPVACSEVLRVTGGHVADSALYAFVRDGLKVFDRSGSRLEEQLLEPLDASSSIFRL